MSTQHNIASKVVVEVLKNFRDRRGFRHLLDSLQVEDEDTYKEIVDSLVEGVQKILEREHKELVEKAKTVDTIKDFIKKMNLDR